MELVLTADSTRGTGTRPSRRLRREGRVPCVSTAWAPTPSRCRSTGVSCANASRPTPGINAVIELEIEGDRHTSIVKDVQRHPVRRDVIHVDFLRVDPNKVVTVEVPVLITGEAKKVANMQGVVDQQLFRVSVSVRPGAIPNEIELDVSELDIGDVITVADLTMPPGVEAISDADATVVQGLATRSTIVLASRAAIPTRCPSRVKRRRPRPKRAGPRGLPTTRAPMQPRMPATRPASSTVSARGRL